MTISKRHREWGSDLHTLQMVSRGALLFHPPRSLFLHLSIGRALYSFTLSRVSRFHCGPKVVRVVCWRGVSTVLDEFPNNLWESTASWTWLDFIVQHWEIFLLVFKCVRIWILPVLHFFFLYLTEKEKYTLKMKRFNLWQKKILIKNVETVKLFQHFTVQKGKDSHSSRNCFLLFLFLILTFFGWFKDTNVSAHCLPQCVTKSSHSTLLSHSQSPCVIG